MELNGISYSVNFVHAIFPLNWFLHDAWVSESHAWSEAQTLDANHTTCVCVCVCVMGVHLEPVDAKHRCINDFQRFRNKSLDLRWKLWNSFIRRKRTRAIAGECDKATAANRSQRNTPRSTTLALFFHIYIRSLFFQFISFLRASYEIWWIETTIIENKLFCCLCCCFPHSIFHYSCHAISFLIFLMAIWPSLFIYSIIPII